MVQPEWALIWHNKSNCDELQGQDEEFFTRFIFEYISFIAILNYQIVQTAYNNVGTINDLSIVDPSARKLINNIVNKNKYKDRDIIQI